MAFFEAHDITDGGKKKATLLSACGAQTYKLMSDLVAPLKSRDKIFENLNFTRTLRILIFTEMNLYGYLLSKGLVFCKVPKLRLHPIPSYAADRLWPH